MEIRNIKRTYCFGKAFGKFNKKSYIKLIPSNVFILTALHDQRKGITVNELREYLRKGKHLYRHSLIRDRCRWFVEQGWIAVSDEQFYSLTDLGRKGLEELERRIRNERLDK